MNKNTITTSDTAIRMGILAFPVKAIEQGVFLVVLGGTNRSWRFHIELLSPEHGQTSNFIPLACNDFFLTCVMLHK